MALRKLSPGGYEYLTGAVACADRGLEPGESLADYYFAHGYPPGEWFGRGARALGVSGRVTQAQMTALFGEGRHPNADAIEAAAINKGASVEAALAATQLGRRFPRYGGWDDLRDAVTAAYKDHNRDHDRPVGAPIDPATRDDIRRRVYRREFARAHDSKTPTDKELATWLAQQRGSLKTAVAGYEMIFAPPKSVSVAWALGDDPTRELIARLHRQAVVDALTYVEREVAFTRQGDRGEAQVDVQGITAVIFDHWDSRSGDPHLHTHVPISTKVRRATDGKWTSLDGRTLFAANVTVSEFYNSRLRDLCGEHGATWIRKASGQGAKRPVWELATVPTALVEGFSRRSRQVNADRARRIVAFRRAHGREPRPKELLELSRQAQYASRRGKQPPRTLRQHLDTWRGDAAGMIGTDAAAALSTRILPTRSRDVRAGAVDVAVLAERTLRVVQAHHAHFNRWNIEAEAHRQSAHLTVSPQRRDQLIGAITDAALGSEGCVALTAPVLVREPEVLRRRDGESVFTTHNSDRYSTTATLRAEADLLTHARELGGHRVPGRHVRRALKTETLNEGQRAMVASFAQSTRRLQLALAPAGAGKTTAMRVFAHAWRSSGGRVFAFAPSARAAQELGETIDADPHTLHQLITTAQAHGLAQHRFDFRPGDVLVIDEAAMAGTHTLHQVVTYALERDADVRLVGDHCQLGAVEAGGAVILIARAIGAEQLHEVVRFDDPLQAEASMWIRNGHPAGLDYYLDRRLVSGGSRETMRDAAHHGWRDDLAAGRHSLLIVPTLEDIVDLNAQARAERIRDGHVHPADGVALHDGTRASAGDYIVTRRNDRHLTVGDHGDFVKNGDTWHVHQVHPDGRITAIHRANGQAAVLPADYVSRNVELAYAATVHRVQGMTCDTSHQLVPDTLTRELLYTGITRGRDTNRLYVITHHHVIDEHHETPPEQSARNVLHTVLGRTGIETSATEILREALHDYDSLATLIARHNYVARYGDTDRYLTLLATHAPAALQQPAEPALIQTLRNAHDLGWQPARLLATKHLVDGIDEGDDPAALLQWRIDRHIRHHTPPARVAEPQPADVARWRALVTTHVPDADVESEQWNRVWTAAANGKAAGLNPDAAIHDAAGGLADREPRSEVVNAAWTESMVRGLLADQHVRGHGHAPALPWLARPDFDIVDQHHGFRDYLRDLNDAITTRADQLHADVLRDPPTWAEGLGPRPENPVDAERWDRLTRLAAAFRDTYNVTANDPDQPLGPVPMGAEPRAKAWRDITNEWKPTMTTPTDHTERQADSQRAVIALRGKINELRADPRDVGAEHRDAHEHELRRHAAEARDHYDEGETSQQSSVHNGLGY